LRRDTVRSLLRAEPPEAPAADDEDEKGVDLAGSRRGLDDMVC